MIVPTSTGMLPLAGVSPKNISGEGTRFSYFQDQNIIYLRDVFVDVPTTFLLRLNQELFRIGKRWKLTNCEERKNIHLQD